MATKVRIVKRTCVDGRVKYVIQQKHFLFRWWWVDAWMNGSPSDSDSFDTLEETRRRLCYFDGSKCVDEVVTTDMGRTKVK
jgi:hypothetical protein